MKTNIVFYLRLASFFLILMIMICAWSVRDPYITDYKGISTQEENIDVGVPVKIFKAVVVDNDNNKWFLTEAGIISFNGEKWKLHYRNRKVLTQDLKGFALEVNSNGQELWIATPQGATVATLPVDALTGATTYHTGNTPILSNNVISVATGNGQIRWFGTDKGISAFKMDKWLNPSYEGLYPGFIFEDYPILSMAVSMGGDTLYAGTKGAGVVRILHSEVDAMTGASVYAKWGPINLPSDEIHSIFISSDGVKWFGTNSGVARHSGNNTLENWTAYTTKDGLINNFVQAIIGGKDGRIWLGTRGGISVFNGSVWTSLTETDGLISNNVLCLAIDKTGVLWIGTDNGVSRFENGAFVNYR